MKLRDGAAMALLLAGIVMLAACTPGPDAKSDAGSSSAPPASASSAPTPSGAPTPSSPPATGAATPSPEPTVKAVKMPTDCRAILSKSVLDQLGDTPLNDPALGPVVEHKKDALHCIWRFPQADTTGLETRIERMPRGDALAMLNGLADDEGFTCFTPDGGTRCEKTWQNTQYPVTDGRTLFWRDGMMIDTRYSNLAPTGYTSSIIKAIWG